MLSIRPLLLTLVRSMSDKRFRLSDYDCIGFDLDNTLALYDEEAINDMQYRCLMEGLMKRGYGKPIFKGRMKLATRGLFLDLDKKVLLTLNSEGKIHRTWRGSTEVKLNQGNYWNPGADLIANKFREDSYVFSDLSDTAVPSVIADLIDSGHELGEVWPQVFDSILEMFAPDGIYYKYLLENTDDFVRHRPKLSAWLKSLSPRKKTFLLTGARQREAEAVASQALGPQWKDLFDKIVYNARKPNYFTSHRESDWIKGNESSGGCWEDITRSIPCSRPLYFGDNILHDIIGAHSINMDSILIVPELAYQRSDVHWGGFLNDDGIPTIWSALAKKYAKTIVPSLNMLAFKPLDYLHEPSWG